MGFTLGFKSLKELNGVKPPLVAVAKLAIRKTKQDYTVFDGLRTMTEHLANVAKGVSKAKVSKHVTGDAMDLVPYVKGKPVWDAHKCIEVAKGVRLAAIELNVPITWGAVWDRDLRDLSEDLEAEVNAYVQRRKKAKQSVFLDYPHFESR